MIAVFALLVLALAGPAVGQVVFDAASNATPATASAANPVIVNWNHTTGLAKKSYLVVGVSIDLNGGGQTVTSVVYASEAGGQNQGMALLSSVNNGTNVRVELWGLAAPEAGTHQITVTVANGGGQNTVVVAGAKSFSNVFQTASTGAAVTNTGTSLTPAVTVTNSAFDYVVDAVAFNGNVALTAGAGQTNAYNVTNATLSNFSGAGSAKTASQNTTMSWTATGANQAWAIAAVPLQSAVPQILFDAASSVAAATISAANPVNLSWSHSTTNAANRYIVVAVTMQMGNTAGKVVASVTYGTEGGGPNQAMAAIGLGQTSANNHTRVELWGLAAPASGTHTISVSVTNAGGTTITVVAGAQSFSGVDQNTPLGTAAGAAGTSTNPNVTVANSAYDYVVDGVAYDTNDVLTPGATQDQRFQVTNTPGGGRVFTGASSGSRGYANTTMQWTGVNSVRWAIFAVPLKGLSIGVTKTASADVIKLGQPVTYTLTTTNYSAATVNAVTITDAIPGTATFVSQTGCSGTGPVTCTVATLASGATAGPFTITVLPNSSGLTSNFATVTYTGHATPNSSETVTTVAQTKVCANPGKDGIGGTLAGVVNDYWPGSASVASGSSSLTVGARAAGGFGNTIASGDLIIVMQMQDAAFDATNDETYGEGTGSTRGTGVGSGAAKTLNNAGRWEYVVATGAVPAGGGTLTFSGGGAGGGLLYSYTSQTFATTTTEGQRTFQIIRVPQYITATLGSTLTAIPWNGATGGILAIDVSGTLSLGGATVSVNGLGYRGGGGRVLAGDATAGLAATDFRTLSTLTTNGSKAEGIAGTPRYVYQNGATIGAPTSGNAPLDTAVEGYVNGSYGRGAPGNAGGGSTDGIPTTNADNSGGGGGGNGGFGGAGGNGWNCNCPSGGQGGGGISPSLTRITMGGGGGAGTTNNASAETCNAPPTCRVNVPGDWTDTEAGANGYYSSGANGGGVIIFRALDAVGTATLTANGFTAYNTGRDGSGGGGAGGSILISTQTGTLSGLTIQAKGGNGGNAWLTTAPGATPGERHGPGGGGGGGYVLVSSTPASIDVSGGQNGVTTTANNPYGAQPGTTGMSQDVLGSNVLPGGDGATCAVADLAVTDSSPSTPVDWLSNITFTQTVVNNGPSAADSVVYTQTIPASSTFQSMSVPAGWTCITPAVGGTGIVSCTRPTLSPSDGVQNFSLVVKVNLGTPSGFLITDTNTVSSSTTDSNTANNVATASTPDVAIGQADMSVTLSNNATNTTTAGSVVTFTSVAKNIGASAAAGATWSMAIPANMTFTAANAAAFIPPPGWTCITPGTPATSGTISCSATSNIASGISATFTPPFTVTAGTAAGTVITGTANTGATNDQDTSNNTASSSFTVRGAAGYDMAVTMSDSPDPVVPGNNLTYTSVVTNNGPANAPATGAGVQWTMAVPSGTNFQSVGAIPAGWACATPAVGATSGSITCTYQVGGVNQAFTPATTPSTFKPVFQVNAGTATGSTITGSATVNINGTTVNDNVPANNTASASTLVASSTSADCAIVKTNAPNPVGQGQLVNYSLQVTNNGPAIATNVVISDPLPAGVSFVSSSISASVGSCSGTTTVTCTISSLAVGNTATITIIVQANDSGTITNTASITGADQTDPVSSNNSSTANLTVFIPTVIKLRTFTALQNGNKVVVSWQTSSEADNLGFNVYRDTGGVKTKVNNKLIGGSAFVGKGRDPKSGYSYRLNDTLPTGTLFVQYWLEDLDTHGVKTMHGPVSTTFDDQVGTGSDSNPLAGLGQSGSTLASAAGVGALRPMTLPDPTAKQTKQQLDLAADSGLKIFVHTEGWYRIAKSDMLAAGFDPGTNANQLSLYCEGTPQPIVVNTGSDHNFGTNDTIEFYGLGLDTPATGARTYWLRTSGDGNNRLDTTKTRNGDTLTGSIPFTYQRIDRSVFVAALLNTGEGENFFGPIITTDPTSQDLSVANLDPAWTGNASLAVVIQGGTDGIQHQISVGINSHLLGTAIVNNTDQKTFLYTVPQSWLVAGANPLTLTALNGDNDVSVLVSVQLVYQHLLRADNGMFEAQLPGSKQVTVGGFTNKTIRAIDITDPFDPSALDVTVAPDGTGFKATFTTPSSSTPKTVMVFSDDRVLGPPEMAFTRPSTWSDSANKLSADLIIITNSAFAASAGSLKSVRDAGGTDTVVVDVDDIYDEFNFGIRSPQAIRSFLQSAKKWKGVPKYVLLIGDASIDPRNYLGLGTLDFVPTKLIPTAFLKTASDGWFTDFNGNGIEDMAIGRLPVRTATEAATVVGKITSRGKPSGTWAQTAVLVADDPATYDFEGAAAALKKLLPASVTAQTINISKTATPHNDIVNAFNAGALLVDYTGHGSVEIWSNNVFNSTDAKALTNGSKLPVVFAMTCLNAYFHDLYSEALGSALLTAPNGGAVAVWSSSTLTDPVPQTVMNQELFRQLFGSTASGALGDAILKAKAATNDMDVRRSWMLLGDPSMKLR